MIGVVGDDPIGAWLLAQARTDGVDVTPVVRRPDAETGLVVDVVDRHVEHPGGRPNLTSERLHDFRERTRGRQLPVDAH